MVESFSVAHNDKERVIGQEAMRTFEKAVMLRALDHHWKEHLAVMDQLRQSVNLRGYGQKNPVQEYKRESFSMFTELLDTINSEMVKAVCGLSLSQLLAAENEAQGDKSTQDTSKKAKSNLAPRRTPASNRPTRPKVGRNDPCPCGSGKKYKHCHG